jgi:hypothetical protein
MEDVGLFYGHFGLFYGHVVYFVAILSILRPFGISIVVARKIWQPCYWTRKMIFFPSYVPKSGRTIQIGYFV